MAVTSISVQGSGLPLSVVEGSPPRFQQGTGSGGLESAGAREKAMEEASPAVDVEADEHGPDQLVIGEAVTSARGFGSAGGSTVDESIQIGGERLNAVPLPTVAYSLTPTAAWQDLVNLRAQVRNLEAGIEQERQQGSQAQEEVEKLRVDIRELEMRQRLQKTVSQTTQMEYIRNVFRKFVETMPLGVTENEALIPVLLTFFQFPDDEAKLLQARRAELQQPKRGWFSR